MASCQYHNDMLRKWKEKKKEIQDREIRHVVLVLLVNKVGPCTLIIATFFFK